MIHRKKSTLLHVAELAGVSLKTASRVVRKEPNVREETRQRVEHAMREVSYRPSIAPRASVGARSFLIGLVFDNPNSSYVVDLLRGATEQTRAEGYNLVVEPIRTDDSNIAENIKRLVIQSNLDGIVLPPPICDLDGVLSVLDDFGTPYVGIGPNDNVPLNRPSMDDEAAAAAMTDHLIQLGHTDIAFVKGRAGTLTTRQRLKGYERALRNSGLCKRSDLIVDGDYTFKSGLHAGEQLLQLNSAPTAVFASNDEMAAGVMTAAMKRNLVVPDDLSVAGFDDSPTATMIWPQLTTVRQPIDEMSKIAISMLVSQLRDREVASRETKVEYQLIVRDSTSRLKQN